MYSVSMTNDDTPAPRKRKIKRAEAQESITETLQREMAEFLSQHHEYKQLANEYTAKAKLAQTYAIERMMALEAEKTEFTDSRGVVRDVRLIRPERADIDENTLRERVPADVWEKITKVSVDRTAIDRAVKDDLISMETLTECVNLIPASPYVKITESKKGSEE